MKKNILVCDKCGSDNIIEKEVEMPAYEIITKYHDQYIAKHGEPPKEIFLSKSMILELEKKYGNKKLDTIMGMKVFSHTYEKYRFKV